ncbi:hypothetical protein VP01_3192g1 [Puccinia sorghi]|uniref:Reverse transcriptase domain-containing protein n=1 Tax=Puccinia sorghi TaxID=27349 RepID=A0A0L6UZC2_9BASI|nr:hypothetical protein VP01_3192g1 [Puccinia sorghi]
MHSALEHSLRHHKNLCKGIVKIKPILQPNRRRRFDLLVKHENSAGLQKNPKVNEEQKLKLLTWNINGIKSKLPALKHLLQEKQVAIASIQEQLRTIKNYFPGIQGYNLFDRPKENGFRGKCLYVHQTLNAHEIDTQTKHIIYLKVYGQTGAHPWHIISVYMPSELNIPSYITILGDLNDKEKQILNHIKKSSLRNLHLEIIKYPNSAFTRKVEGQYIDHLLNKPEVVSMVKNVIVEKYLFNISDHWPVIQNMNIWNVITVDEIQDETQLSETAKWWVDTLNTIGKEVHLLSIPREQQQFKFDRKTLKLIKNSRCSRQKLEKVITEGIQPSNSLTKLQETSIRDQNRAKLAIRKFAKLELLSKNFHRLIQQGQGNQHGNMDNAPCFNEQEILVTSAEDILKARAEYAAKLASEAKCKQPSDSDLFNSIDEDDSDVSDIDEEVILTTPEFLMAIRQIQRNATPGKSGVLSMHLKKFLEIECQLRISQDWEGAPRYGKTPFAMPLDYSTVALDCWSLPQTLLVPPLKHLLNIMRACIGLKTQPKIWNEEVLITLPKPGQDQRWLKNTRGITLSCNEGKLLLTILSTKISKKLEKEKFFSKAQAGFRKGQEAVAHVVSLSEILKQQSNNKQNTFSIYVDFKKAFDRVPHEGLWAKIRNIGIHNNLVELIKKGYESSKIQCRLGDQLSDPFTRGIGTRQGCPLSPLLFIIFVNDLFREVTEGIEVPGLNQKVPGLLFADDTLLFADTLEEIEYILKKLEIYCARWNFALGYEKCGIIQYGPPDSLEKNLPPNIKLSEGNIWFMNTCKYLGSWITNEWQEKEPYLLEREHAKTLAVKAKKCFFSSLPLLHDKESHLLCKTRLIQIYIMATGSYGAALISMGQKRTCKIQAVIDLTMRVAYGHKSTSLKPNSLLLCTELGITPYSPHLKTILKDLISSPENNKTGKTWVQKTKRNLDILVKDAEIIDNKWTVDDNILYRVSVMVEIENVDC